MTDPSQSTNDADYAVAHASHDDATPTMPRSAGIIEPHVMSFDEPLELACGQTLEHYELAYETIGSLNPQRTNAVLICHALSGDAHVAGYHPGEDLEDPQTKPGWWDDFIGPGKAIDTRAWYVVCSNVLGGCKGSTGPSSIDPRTGQPYGLNFPIVTIRDMVAAQHALMQKLGIDKWACVVGGSMGGMQALQWAVQYPQAVAGVIPIATTAHLNAQALAFDAVGRQAIRNDPNFGRHTTSDSSQGQADMPPVQQGLAIARMLGHITYLSEQSMHEKFGRRLRHAERYKFDFDSEFSVETYLDHQGEKFVDRFDAYSYLYITKAMDYFDLSETQALTDVLSRSEARFLVLSFTSDWLFPPSASREIVAALNAAGRTVSYVNIESPYGHDAFLLEPESQTRLIRGFLRRLRMIMEGQTVQPVDHQLLQDHHDEKRRLDLEQIDKLINSSESVLDLGCGDGLFLAHLAQRGCPRVQGIDLDEEKCVRCVERGVDVIQADLDQPMPFLTDQSFDVVNLSRTLQTVRHPTVVLELMMRVGSRCVVTFPNFGYWRNRHMVAWYGRVPMSRNLPFSWADTPNLHHLSLRDFEMWTREQGIRIEQRIAMDYESVNEIRWLPNLRATDAIYVFSRISK